MLVALGLGSFSGEVFATDVYVTPDGNEYMPGYQPANAKLIHRDDTVVRPVAPQAFISNDPAAGDSQTPDSRRPRFRVNARVRDYRTGWEMAVFGGGDIAQSGTFNMPATTAAGSQINLHSSTNDRLGGVAGLKLGYTWPDFTFCQNNYDVSGKKITLMPSLEFEGLYINRQFESNGPVTGTNVGGSAITGNNNVQANLTTYAFTINPVLRVQMGSFRPYIGAGVGGAALVMHHPIVSGSGKAGGVTDNFTGANAFFFGDQSDLVPAFQLEAGTDVFLTNAFSFFAEYKFLGLVDPAFGQSGSPVGTNTVGQFKAADIMGEDMVTAGFKYHF